MHKVGRCQGRKTVVSCVFGIFELIVDSGVPSLPRTHGCLPTQSIPNGTRTTDGSGVEIYSSNHSRFDQHGTLEIWDTYVDSIDPLRGVPRGHSLTNGMSWCGAGWATILPAKTQILLARF